MARMKWLRIGATTGVASVLLFLGIYAIAAAQSGIYLARSPAPPASISRGMTETFTWTVTTGGNTPDRVEFRVFDPDGIVVDSSIYPGSSGLSLTRVYTVPQAPPEGRYIGQVQYYSIESGWEASASATFYVAERGHLDVFKFDDFNGNGIQDGGDLPVAGVLIQLRTPFGDVVGKLTGADGRALWQNIAIGSYTVTETVPAGREPTLPPTATVQVDIDATTFVTFANRIPPSAVAGRVWHDANANGVFDAGESGLPDITVFLWADPNGDGVHQPAEPEAAQIVSGAGGVYTFTLVHAGDYVVGPDPTDPDLPIGMGIVGLAQRAVTGLLPGETRIANFGYDDTGVIGGRVWHDANGNGLVEPGEVALPDIGVCLYDDANGNGQVDVGELLIGCQDSGPGGSYSFTGLAAGSYIVEANRSDPDLPPGFVPTTVNPLGVTLAPAENLTANFGFRAPPTPTPTSTSTPTATPTSTATPTPTSTLTPTPGLSCIIGQKVDDLHVGLPGWTIHARPRSAATPVYTTVSDGTGNFHFAGLEAGWWTVWEEMQPGWAAVTSDVFDVQLLPGAACVEVRFKNRQACSQDNYEPDNSPVAARTILPDGIFQKHTLEPPADQDWAAFDAVGGWVYTLRTDNLLGNTDTELTLYAPDGVTPLDYSDDITPGADIRSRIIWRAPATGRYFARVQDYYQSSARGCLGYDLALTVQAFNYAPLIVRPPAATPTPTPTATATVTPTPTPTATRRPILGPFTIPGLSHPKGIGVHLATHRLYVASRNTDVVYEVDPLGPLVLRMIPVGRQPFGVAVNTTTNKIYVANFLSDDLSVIDGATGLVIKTISFAPYGEPTYVAINETTNRVYVPLHEGGRLAVINGATDALLTTLEVGAGAFGVAADPLLNRVYVSCRDSRLVRVVDAAANSVLWSQTAYPGGEPFALGINPGLGRLYVSFAPPGSAADGPTQVLAYHIPAGGPSLLTAVLVGRGGLDGGGGIAANPNTHHVFVTNSLNSNVSVFDGNTHMLLATVPVGTDPMAVTINPGLGYAFVGSRGSNTVVGLPDGY